MTEEKKNKNYQKTQITFYETFDDEIVRISSDVSFDPTEVMGGPRPSYHPIPVIPGFYTLSDAFENARRRLEAEDLETTGQKTIESTNVDGTEEKSRIQPMNSMIYAVTPGHFSSDFTQRRTTPSASGGTRRKSARSAGERGSTTTINQRENYILAEELIEELNDEEIVQEKSYSDEHRIRQSQSFDFILDETMRSLIEEQEANKVKLG